MYEQLIADTAQIPAHIFAATLNSSRPVTTAQATVFATPPKYRFSIYLMDSPADRPHQLMP